MATDTSSIDQKNEENNNTSPEKTNNWGKFLTLVIQSFVTAILIGLIGSNFVYLSRSNINLMFPTDPDARPYKDKTKNGVKLPPMFKENNVNNAQKGGKSGLFTGGGACGEKIDFTTSKMFDNKYFKNSFEYGFPYNLVNSDSDESFGGILTKWFANTVKYSYVWLRTCVTTVLDVSDSLCDLTPKYAKDVVPFILGPILVSLLLGLSHIWFIPTIISMFWHETNNWGFALTIIGLFFGWTWLLSIGLNLWQTIGLMCTFILLPPIIGFNDIKNIISEKFNSTYLLILFSILVITNAFSTLTTEVAVTITIVFIINIINSIRALSQKQQV